MKVSHISIELIKLFGEKIKSDMLEFFEWVLQLVDLKINGQKDEIKG